MCGDGGDFEPRLRTKNEFCGLCNFRYVNERSMSRIYEYIQRDSMGLVSMHGLKLAGGISGTLATTSLHLLEESLSISRQKMVGGHVEDDLRSTHF